MAFDAGSAVGKYILSIDQPKQAAAELKALFASIRREGEALGNAVPNTAGRAGGDPAAQQQRTERAILARAAAEARLVQVQNTGVNAARGLAQAEQIYQAALARVDQTSIDAIRTQTQLAAVQNRLAAQAGGGLPVLPRSLEAFGGEALDQIKSGLLGIVGPAALATGALGALQAVVARTEEGFRLNAAIEQTQRSIALQVAGLRDSAAMFERASTFGQRYRLTQEETNNALRASTSILRQSRASTEEILGTLLRLQQLSPEQGIEGAALALKELQGGSTTSLVQRFEVSVSQAAKLRAEIRGGADAVEVLSQFLTQNGIGMEALEARTAGATGKMLELRQESEKLTRALGSEATGPGLAILEARIAATKTATNALKGDIVDLNKILGAANPAFLTGGIVAYNVEVGRMLGILPPATEEVKQNTQATEVLGLTQAQVAQNTRILAGEQAHLRDEHLNSGRIIQQTSAIIQDFNAHLTENAAKSQISAAQATILKARQEEIAQASVLAARGMLGSGDQAVLMAQKYNLAKDQAELLINAQQRLDADQAARDQRAGERSGGAVRTEAEQKALTKARDLNAEFERQQAEKRKQQHDAEVQLRLAQAKTAAQRIAILRQELAGTDDVLKRLQLQTQIASLQNSADKTRIKDAGQVLNLEERIRDSKEAQLKASIDARKLAAQDVLDRLKEDQEIAQAQRVLANSRDPRFRAAAQARLDLIGANRDERQLALQQAQATAGGTIVNGRVFQSIPSAGGQDTTTPPPPSTGARPGLSFPSPTAGGGGQTVIQFVVDGKVIAEIIEPRIIEGLRNSRQQSSASGRPL
jgi:hypothetical protein